jgi:3-oxoacyl-[acyl-carrier protein] reductase
MSESRQVALISGGSKGLGAALTADLLARGYAVATFARTRSPVVADFEARGADAYLFRELDATDFAAVGRFAADVVKQFGRIDLLVNNAAQLHMGTLPLMRADVIHKTLALNLEAPIQLSRVCSRYMIHAGSGCIVNISTVNAVRGYRGVSVYAAAKAGLDAMTRSLARELGARGIRVNSVAPGYFESELTHGVSNETKEQLLERTPLKRLGTVQDIVAAVRFLSSPESSFITGQVLIVDGGITC